MALADTTNTSETQKPHTEINKHEKREKPPTKVVVRRLPPGITLEEFLTQVSPIPDYDYIYTIKGDMTLGENAFSRVYINFVKADDIYLFKEKFDNYVFVDTKGHEYAAVVEFAAFQKIPKKRGKPRPDPKIGTIGSDPLYLEFLESLKQQPNQEEKPEFSYQPSSESNKYDSSTPLLDYLKQRKIDKLKSKEEKREERRRKEIERKRLREEERRKRLEEKSPTKHISVKSSHSKTETAQIEKSQDKVDAKTAKEQDLDKEKNTEKVEKGSEKQTINHKSKDSKKYDDYKSNTKYKSKYPTRSEKYDTYDKRDYKSRRDDYRDRDRRGRYDDHRKDDFKKESEVKQFTKKVKKYSERREERKYEIKKAEQEKDDNTCIDENKLDKEDDNEVASKTEQATEKVSREHKAKEDLRRSNSKEDDRNDNHDKLRNKENDPRVQRRIRNKDRPTMQLYQPGMLSKRRHHDDDKDSKEASVKD